MRAYRTALDQLIGYATSASGISISEVTFGLLTAAWSAVTLTGLLPRKDAPHPQEPPFCLYPFFFRYAAAANPRNIVLLAGLTGFPAKTGKFSGVDYMSETAVKPLLEQPGHKNTPRGRDQVFMILMYDSVPRRIQEMLDLRVCDIRLGNTPTAVLERERPPKYAVSPDAGNDKPFPELYEAVPSGRADAFNSSRFLCGTVRRKASHVR